MGSLDALEQMKNPSLQLPSAAQSWISVSSDYVAADGSTPITAIVELRTADGAHRADFFDKNRLAAFVRASSRTQRLSSLTRCSQLVAVRREDDGRWAVHVVRYGRLAAAGHIPPGADAGAWVSQLRAEAETVLPRPGPTPAATAEESEKILRWLESDGVRLVHVDGEWTCPVGGAHKHLKVHDAVNESRKALVPFDEKRSVGTVHQPVVR